MDKIIACMLLSLLLVSAYISQKATSSSISPDPSTPTAASDPTRSAQRNATSIIMLTTPPTIFTVQERDPLASASGSMNLRYVTSMWLVGVIPGKEAYETCEVLIFTRREWLAGTPIPTFGEPQDTTIPASLATALECSTLPRNFRSYHHDWPLPAEVGDVKIISFSNLRIGKGTFSGTVHVVSTNGYIGAFDLTTEQWSWTM